MGTLNLNDPQDPLSPSGVELAVCMDIARRQKHGIEKYRTTVSDNQLTLLQWHQHHYEELLDAAIYTKKIIIEISKLQDFPEKRGMAPDQLAALLYTEYCKSVGGKAFNGDTLPSWEEFSKDPNKQVQAAAWITVASLSKELLK